MKDRRIVIETDNITKYNLDRILEEQHKSLTEWFLDKIEESATSYDPSVNLEDKEAVQIKTLSEIREADVVLTKFQEFDWSFTDENTSYLSHNIHPYPAKYIPHIPRTVIKMLSLPGEVVWDPFGGSGTTALESLLMGRQAISSDINPIANIIGRAKTVSLTPFEEKELEDMVDSIFLLSKDMESFDRIYQMHQQEVDEVIPAIPNIEKWFASITISELAFIKWSIVSKLSSKAQIVALSTFSKIIIRASFQDSETRYVSKKRDVIKGSVLQLYSTELKSVLIKVKQLSPILRYRDAKFITANIFRDHIVENDSIDLIVSSPPYPNATDYHLYHRFRIFWLGFTPKEMAASEIGSHLRHQKENTEIEQYLLEMRLSLIKMYAALRHGRYSVLVLGDGVFKGEIFKTAELLGEIAQEIGFVKVGIVTRKLHETKRSFSSAGRRLREEKLLILRKQDRQQLFTLNPPPYQLWEYENYLRKLEVKNLLTSNLLTNNDDFSVLEISSLCVDLLRKLTFTHGFSANSHAKESTWQAILENGDANDSAKNRKDPKYITHGLHAYKGKFYPQLAKSLFNIANINPGSNILDPFCGSGTVLLEGALSGYKACGLDLNPLALKIARVKTKALGLDYYWSEKLINEFLLRLPSISSNNSDLSRYDEDVLKELKSWFPLPVLHKLTNILSNIDEIPDKNLAELLEVCVSSIVRDISQQEPKDLRIRRRAVPIEDADVVALLTKKVKEQLSKIMKYAQNAKYSPSPLGSAGVYEGDCRLWKSFQDASFEHSSIDAVITSPPYATALPYIDTDRLSILLLFGVKNSERAKIEKSLIGAREITTSERKETDKLIEERRFDNILSRSAIATIEDIYKCNKESDVGFRKKNTASLLYKYYNDMSNVFINLNKVVRKNGDMFFVIGDNKTNTGDREVLIESGKALVEIGNTLGWTLKEVIPITVTQENRLHNKNGILVNDIIWFRK